METLAAAALQGVASGGDANPRPQDVGQRDDVFADGRKVAPAVIGEDPPGHGGSS